MKTIDYQKQGKKNRAAGQRFEIKVKKDLELKGFIVAKWTNTIEWSKDNINLPPEERIGKLVPVKNKFRGKGIPMMLGAGFPDFIGFKRNNVVRLGLYEVLGVEAKSNGYLDKQEKEKCKWLLENNIFSKILIASKSKVRGKIDYKEFKTQNKIEKEVD